MAPTPPWRYAIGMFGTSIPINMIKGSMILFYVDILGHIDATGRFTEDFVEFQQEFFFHVVAPFVTALELPLTGPLVNPDPQRNDVPDRLRIEDGE